MFQKRCYIPVRALTRPTISFRTPKLRELSNFRDFGKNNELCGEKRDREWLIFLYLRAVLKATSVD